MSRARKFDHALLEREYIYDAATPPISITGLADKHGMARGHLADLARRGEWFKKRREVRLTIGEKVLDAMTDDWAETNSIIRNRMLELSTKLLDEAEKALAAGEIKITKVADVATIIAMQRTLLGDQMLDQANKDGPTIIDMNAVPMDPDQVREMLPLLKRLVAGGEADEDIIDSLTATGEAAEQGHARADAGAGPAGTQQD